MASNTTTLREVTATDAATPHKAARALNGAGRGHLLTYVAAAVLVAGLIVWGSVMSALYVNKTATTLSVPQAPVAAVDVAVVGAGPSGTYSAWRLTNSSGGRLDVRIWEATARVGGRTYSVPLDSRCPTAVAELGGMRVRVGTDTTVLQVAKLLNIPMLPFNMNGGPPLAPLADDPANTVWLRGTRMKLGALWNMTLAQARVQLKYDLSEVPPSVAPNTTMYALLNYITDAMVAVASRPGAVLSPSDVCGDPAANLARTYGQQLYGKPVHSWAAANLAEALGFSRDFSILADDASGYDFDAALPSAYWSTEALHTAFLNMTDTAFVRPAHGLMSIAKTLADTFEAERAAAGRTEPGVNLNRRLVKLDRAPPGSGFKYALTFAVTQTSGCSRQTRTVGAAQAHEVVYANKVVLGLTQQALLLLRQPDDGVLFGRDASYLDPLLQAVTTANAEKLFMVWRGASSANWFNKALNASAGRHFVSNYAGHLWSWYPGTSHMQALPTCPDLTAVQLYLAGPEREKLWRSMQLASIAAAANSSACTAAPFQAVPNLLLDTTCRACFPADQYYGPAAWGVPNEAKDRLLEYLSDLTGVPVAQIPPIDTIMWQIWDSAPAASGSAAHIWNSGAPFWTLNDFAAQPRPTEDVHLVGEAWASPAGQFWTNGALETAERMLTVKMGLPPLQGFTREQVCAMNPFVSAQPQPRA